MLVVDPKSGRKYHLQEDDHSLTDKELHVYHRSHTTSTPAAAAAAATTTTNVVGKPRSAPTSPTNNNNSTTAARGGRNTTTNSNNLGSLFVHTNNTTTTATSPTTIDDEDVRTYNSGTVNMMMNDDAHTLETASALTEVSYYTTHYHYGNGRGDNNMCGVGGVRGNNTMHKSSSSPFDCMLLPTSCHSVGESTLLGEGVVGGTAAIGNAGAMTSTKCKNKEGRDDVESMEKGRYQNQQHTVAVVGMEEKKETTSSPYEDYQQQLQQQQLYPSNYYQQPRPPPSPITAAFSAIMDSPRLLFSGFFGNTDSSPTNNNNIHHDANNLAATSGVARLDQLLHPLASPPTSPRDSGGGGIVGTSGATAPPVVHHISFRRVVCMVVFPNEVKSTLDGQTTGLLGMKFVQSGHDFQAHVRWVQRGSKAERMGVRKGDIVSVSCIVPLP